MTRFANKTRYFYDCEFLEDGKTIDLLSIGIRCDDGREYYAVNRSADWGRVAQHDWLVANVVPHLPMLSPDRWVWSVLTDSPLDVTAPEVKWKTDISREVYEFLLADGNGDNRNTRELWAWYGAYDHVALCQLFGRMIDLPEGIPMFTRDIKQECERLGNPSRPSQTSTEHHALADARYNQIVFDRLERVEARQLATSSQLVACCPMDEETSLEVLEKMHAQRCLAQRCLAQVES